MKPHNLKVKFEKAVDDMASTNHYLASEITKLGYPQLANDIPTAGVGWDETKKKIIFLFNPDFAEKLTDEEFSFAVAHECIHLMHSHVFLLRDEIDKLKNLQKSNNEINKFKMKMNIAMDCVVNDSLVNLYGLPKVFAEDPEVSGKIKIWYGQDVIKTDCEDMTATDVYKLLPEDLLKEQQGQSGAEGHEQWDSFFNPDGSLKEKFVDTVKNFVQKNIQNSALSDEEAKNIDDMKKAMTQSTDPTVAKAGRECVGLKRPIDGLTRESINWSKILFKFVETLRTEDIWTKVNRKLISVYPDAILPSWRDKEKEKIFVAIDSSGSISQEALRLFVSVLKNTPKRFDIEAISFDTACYPYDIKGDKAPLGGGGTDFTIIEKYILENCKKYPKAIFVLTDGEGTTVNPKHPDRWGWLLYGSCSTYCIGKMKNWKIQNLLEKNAKL